MVAIITTKFPLAPALARQKMAKMVAVITTKFPLAPALARQQTAKMVAFITTKFPLAPALARQQMAEMVLTTCPHLGGLGNDCGGGADEDDEDEYALGHQIDAPPKIWPENMTKIIAAIVRSTSERPKSPLFKFEMNGAAAESNFLVLRKFNFDLESRIAGGIRIRIPKR